MNVLASWLLLLPSSLLPDSSLPFLNSLAPSFCYLLSPLQFTHSVFLLTPIPYVVRFFPHCNSFPFFYYSLLHLLSPSFYSPLVLFCFLLSPHPGFLHLCALSPLLTSSPSVDIIFSVHSFPLCWFHFLWLVSYSSIGSFFLFCSFNFHLLIPTPLIEYITFLFVPPIPLAVPPPFSRFFSVKDPLTEEPTYCSSLKQLFLEPFTRYEFPFSSPRRTPSLIPCSHRERHPLSVNLPP